MKVSRYLAALLLSFTSSTASLSFAAETDYIVDPEHTYPSFEVDHLGLSYWRGKFNRTTGKVTYDPKNLHGTVEIYIDPASIDFGHSGVTEKVKGKDILNVTKFPEIVFVGSMEFAVKAPTAIKGQLTLHGQTRPVSLTISQFDCKTNPITYKYTCGADAFGKFDRADFGIDFGADLGMSTSVFLTIQIEAIRKE